MFVDKKSREKITTLALDVTQDLHKEGKTKIDIVAEGKINRLRDVKERENKIRSGDEQWQASDGRQIKGTVDKKQSWRMKD